MTSRSNLKVIPPDPGDDPLAPPRHLQDAGRQLWASVMSQYAIDDSGGRMLLEQSCVALDRAEELRREIDADGPVIRTKAGIKDHPALKHEVSNRALAIRTLQQIGLDLEPVLRPGRPPGSRR